MALNRHVREECGRILYTCPYCHNIMPMKFNLLNHLKKEHGYLLGNQMHTCKTCGNTYVYYSSLTRHVRDECGKAPKHKCLYCAKRTKLRCNLLKHMRTKHGFEQGTESIGTADGSGKVADNSWTGAKFKIRGINRTSSTITQQFCQTNI
ncbi:hypothetical protein DMN91_012936 [Ooceraea biroi]|uniref:C2H2-type domain-containing protein n=1 Tax=Ooceraea biroi TaxID=2015173 RepID=A0A3L8D477_OOCBI|nr:hypothetical protein DMN91_012936 [Ooceraea biroi]